MSGAPGPASAPPEVADPRRPVPRGLAALALVLATAALIARGLSSGTGQALLAPGSVAVLDTLGALAALAAFGARATAGEPLLSASLAVLAPLVAFCGLAALAAVTGEEPGAGARTAFSWASLALLALGIQDLARRPGVARALAGVLVGTATAASILALYQLAFELPLIQEIVRGGPDVAAANGIPHELYEAYLWRASDPMATGPFILPSHLACDVGLVLPLAVAATVLAFRHRREDATRLPWKLLAVVVIALLAGAGFARSKGASLAVAVAVVLFAWQALPAASPWRRRLKAAAAALLLAAVAWTGLGWALRRESFGMGMSLQVRLEYWQAALGMVRESPLRGHGLESYAVEYSAHKTPRAEEVKHAHQDTLELAAEEGIPGALVFLWLVVALGVTGARAVREARASGTAEHEHEHEHEHGGERRSRPGPSRDTAPALPARPAVMVGVAVGTLLLGSLGDVFDASKPGQLLFAAATAILVGRVVDGVLSIGAGEETAASAAATARHLAGAAALAGALAFVVDGLTDFPLRVHGLVAFALSLALLAPELARGETGSAPAPAPRPLRGAVALAAAGLVVFGLFSGRDLANEDAARQHARALCETASRILARGAAQPGRLEEEDRAQTRHLLEKMRPEVAATLARRNPTPAEVREVALALLEEGTQALRLLHEQGSLAPNELVLLVDSEEVSGRLARDARRFETILRELEEATRQRPRSYAVWAEYGRRLSRALRFDDATRAYDEAARLYPTDPRRHLDAGVVRVARLVRDQAPLEGPLRDEAVRELETALALSRVSRLERLHLDDAEVGTARALLTSLGAAPREPRDP